MLFCWLGSLMSYIVAKSSLAFLFPGSLKTITYSAEGVLVTLATRISQSRGQAQLEVRSPV